MEIVGQGIYYKTSALGFILVKCVALFLLFSYHCYYWPKLELSATEPLQLAKASELFIGTFPVPPLLFFSAHHKHCSHFLVLILIVVTDE